MKVDRRDAISEWLAERWGSDETGRKMLRRIRASECYVAIFLLMSKAVRMVITAIPIVSEPY